MAGKLQRKTVKTADRVVTIEDNYIVEQIILTATDELNKNTSLSYLPASPEKVTLDVIGGTSQRRNFDYEVLGQVLNWDGFSLETSLSEGDELRAIYAI